ncbi:hypothetical protein ON010_g167 [Phytophthora cinnamomi]|nr:hypothetical protein ON010_g167 [Phytophthora cinnamomi]
MCMFAARSIKYLGHGLGSDGVRPLQRLVTVVQDFPRPADVVEAMRFVHLAGYYRRFVEGFGALMAPVTKLLRKYAEWEWSIAQEAALERVKSIPLLNLYSSIQAFDNHSELSLMRARSAKCRYRITELECLAVALASHVALKWLMTSPNLTGKLHRWALTLQEFEFAVEHRPGDDEPSDELLLEHERRAAARAPAASEASGASGTTVEWNPSTAKDLQRPADSAQQSNDEGGQSPQTDDTSEAYGDVGEPAASGRKMRHDGSVGHWVAANQMINGRLPRQQQLMEGIMGAMHAQEPSR